MRLIWVLLLGMVVSQPVWAEWVELGRVEAGAGSFTTHLDPTTVRKTAEGRRVWAMDNHDQSQTESFGSFQSTKDLLEIDCAGERMKALQGMYYSGPKGSGKVVSQYDNPGKWQVVSPGSLGEARLKAVCSMPFK